MDESYVSGDWKVSITQREGKAQFVVSHIGDVQVCAELDTDAHTDDDTYRGIHDISYRGVHDIPWLRSVFFPSIDVLILSERNLFMLSEKYNCPVRVEKKEDGTSIYLFDPFVIDMYHRLVMEYCTSFLIGYRRPNI